MSHILNCKGLQSTNRFDTFYDGLEKLTPRLESNCHKV
jgi:hypothetical protein